MASRMLMAEVSEGRVQGRPRFCCKDGVKAALGSRVMTLEACENASKIGRNEKPWCI